MPKKQANMFYLVPSTCKLGHLRGTFLQFIFDKEFLSTLEVLHGSPWWSACLIMKLLYMSPSVMWCKNTYLELKEGRPKFNIGMKRLITQINDEPIEIISTNT